MKHLKKELYCRSLLFRSLKSRMKYLGLNQKDLAAKIGVDASSLNRYLKGSVCPSLDIFIRICNALNLTISFCYHS